MDNTPANEFATVPDELDAAIRLHVRRVFDKYEQNITKTAAALKVSRNTVRKYLGRSLDNPLPKC